MRMLKRILLVEDDVNDVELTLTALAEHHLANEVDVVHDGAEALDYLFRQGTFVERVNEPPLLVLLDIKLPKVDGLEVVRQIRADPGLRLVPVVIFTSSHEERDLVQGYRLGVNAYVVKPVEFQAFVAAVKELGLFWAVLNKPPPSTATKLPPAS